MSLNDYSPVLLVIARNIRDYKTMMSFMLVNKKCCQIVKYVIQETPAIFIALISYDTSPSGPYITVVTDSLKDLYINLHQKHLNEPIKMFDYPIDNYSGPCADCLKYTNYYHAHNNDEYFGDEYFGDNAHFDEYFNGFCGCVDIHYAGIRMVKYFNTSRPKLNMTSKWEVKLLPKEQEGRVSTEEQEGRISTEEQEGSISTEGFINCVSTEGFRMSKTFSIDHYRDERDIKESIEYIDRTSMKYLYYGLPKANKLWKLGIKEWWDDEKWNRFYPATTDTIEYYTGWWFWDRKYTGNDYATFDIHNKSKPYQNTI